MVVESDNVDIGSGSRVSEQSNRFANLVVKDKLRTKGRPRRKSKQLTFNKTAADKIKIKPSRKVRSRKRKRTFMSDDEGSGS